MGTNLQRVACLHLAALLASCKGCDRSPKAASGFSARSELLATIPDGFEMTDGRFSPDGRHVAYLGTKDGGTFAFHGARRWGPYEEVRHLTLLRTGSSLAFVARESGKDRVVVDGEEGAAYDAVGELQAGADGAIVHSAQRGGEWVVVAGRRELATSGTFDPSPLVATGGTRLVYVEVQSGTGKVNLRTCSLDLGDCVQGGPSVDEVLRFAFSDDGRHLAFLASRGGRMHLVTPGAEIPFPDGGSPLDLVVSRSGRTLVTAVVENRVVALLDGKPAGPEQQGMYFPVFGPDGSSYAVVVGDERNALVVNGEEGPLYDKVVTPRFTPDGSRVVYRARKSGERFVVVADEHARTVREHPHYEAVYEVELSPDGRTVGYGVRTGRELWWKVEPL